MPHCPTMFGRLRSTTDPRNLTFRRTLERRGSVSRDENFTRAFEQGLWPSPGRRGAANEHAEPRQRGWFRAALRGARRLEAYFLSDRALATKNFK